jgi:hypothetical protein
MNEIQKRPLTEADIMKRYDEQQEIVLLYVKGHTVPEIVRLTGMRRVEVEEHLKDFREYASQDRAIRTRAKDIVLSVDTHYSDIIKGIYRNVEVAELADDHKSAMAGLKMIADAEAKRVDLLAKAGLLADNTIGDQIAEMERKQSILVDILREISRKHPQIGREIQGRLSEVTGKTEGVVVG